MVSILFACGGTEPEAGGGPTAASIIGRAVEVHGMEDFGTTRLSFVFRDRTYGVETDRVGGYRYTRRFRDSLGGDVLDELTNVGLSRRRNDTLLRLSPKDSAAYAGSVNSVRYFFMLPYALNDPAVHARLITEAPIPIDGQDYHRVEVTFAEEGGGEDFDDVYHYFFNTATGELDYLAYTFTADEGGIRFRRAVNKRRVDGVLVQDYVNYGLNGLGYDILAVVDRYRSGALPELSRIENQAISIGG